MVYEETRGGEEELNGGIDWKGLLEGLAGQD